MRSSLLFLSCALLACGSTGTRHLSYPIAVVGEAAAPFTAGAWTVTLVQARVGFGPVYFCAAGAASGNLCPEAVSEFADAMAVDALDGSEQPLGNVTGVVGPIGSATFDFAWTWLTTQVTPQPTAGAPGGHSAQFAGVAEQGGVQVSFVADVDIPPRIRGTDAVQGRDVEVDVQSETARLTVRLRPSLWWRGVDFDEVAAAATPGQVFRIEKGTRAYNAVVTAMTTVGAPQFEWSNTGG